jgi:hypothetical protein
MKKRDAFNFEEIEAQVVEYIPAPHGRIGIIIPEHEPTEEELDELYRTIATAIIESAGKKRSAT